jgi:hypothetical protein
MRKILFFMLFALVGVFVVLALTSGADAEASTLASPATSQIGQQELPLAQGDSHGTEASVVDVSPVTEVGVCGNGVAVGSVGTQAGCSGDQQAASAGDDQGQSVVGVSPVTEVGVCGNGVAVGSVGTQAGCSGDQQSVTPPGDTVPGDNGDSGGGGTLPTDAGNPPISGGDPPTGTDNPPTGTDNPVSNGGGSDGGSGGSPTAVLAELVRARGTELAQSATPSAALAFTGVPIQRLVGLALALILSGLLLTVRRRRSSPVDRW